MTSKTIVEGFFEAMYTKTGWQELITDDMRFEGPLGGVITGKEAFIGITDQFLQGTHKATVRNMIVEGDTACVLTNYQIGHPDMALLDLDACEIVKVKDGKVGSLEVYFDSKKVVEFKSKMEQQA